MADGEAIWVLAFLVKLHRGEIVKDAADVADKAKQAYLERQEDEVEFDWDD